MRGSSRCTRQERSSRRHWLAVAQAELRNGGAPVRAATSSQTTPPSPQDHRRIPAPPVGPSSGYGRALCPRPEMRFHALAESHGPPPLAHRLVDIMCVSIREAPVRSAGGMRCSGNQPGRDIPRVAWATRCGSLPLACPSTQHVVMCACAVHEPPWIPVRAYTYPARFAEAWRRGVVETSIDSALTRIWKIPSRLNCCSPVSPPPTKLSSLD